MLVIESYLEFILWIISFANLFVGSIIKRGDLFDSYVNIFKALFFSFSIPVLGIQACTKI